MKGKTSRYVLILTDQLTSLASNWRTNQPTRTHRFLEALEINKWTTTWADCKHSERLMIANFVYRLSDNAKAKRHDMTPYSFTRKKSNHNAECFPRGTPLLLDVAKFQFLGAEKSLFVRPSVHRPVSPSHSRPFRSASACIGSYQR